MKTKKDLLQKEKRSEKGVKTKQRKVGTFSFCSQQGNENKCTQQRSAGRGENIVCQLKVRSQSVSNGLYTPIFITWIIFYEKLF